MPDRRGRQSVVAIYLAVLMLQTAKFCGNCFCVAVHLRPQHFTVSLGEGSTPVAFPPPLPLIEASPCPCAEQECPNNSNALTGRAAHCGPPVFGPFLSVLASSLWSCGLWRSRYGSERRLKPHAFPGTHAPLDFVRSVVLENGEREDCL